MRNEGVPVATRQIGWRVTGRNPEPARVVIKWLAADFIAKIR